MQTNSIECSSDEATPANLPAAETESPLFGPNRSQPPISAEMQDEVTQDEVTSFEDLDLSPVMMRALRKIGYEAPSPIQGKVIPPALDGRDILGQARTGTGKTAAFAIPVLELVDPLRVCRNPQALILVPTRELAEQVFQEMERLAYGCKTAITVLAGGKHMRRQIKQLEEGTQIVVGTPGRVYDHIRRRTFKTDDLWYVVLDEADRMLDIGFRPAIEKILRTCPKDRQTLLLSATIAPDIERLAKRYQEDPVHINCSSNQVSVETIEQRYFTVRQEEKFSTLTKLLARELPRQAIIFCRTKRGTDRLHLALEKELAKIETLADKKLACIHGDLNQRDRDRVFAALRAGEIEILVATDVVGRGIDVSTVSHIINYDIPMDCDDYVHRVGRTGRMGREGIAFTFVTADEGQQLTSIELNINRLLERDSFGDEPAKVPSLAKEPETSAEEMVPRKKRLTTNRRKSTDRLARIGGRR
jgi:ATP-dependent RNA helicase DeaD